MRNSSLAVKIDDAIIVFLSKVCQVCAQKKGKSNFWLAHAANYAVLILLIVIFYILHAELPNLSGSYGNPIILFGFIGICGGVFVRRLEICECKKEYEIAKERGCIFYPKIRSSERMCRLIFVSFFVLWAIFLGGDSVIDLIASLRSVALGDADIDWELGIVSFFSIIFWIHLVTLNYWVLCVPENIPPRKKVKKAFWSFLPSRWRTFETVNLAA